MTIYLEHEGHLVEMSQRSYEAEEFLQKLIAEHPHLLVKREVPVADRPDGAGRMES
jgi:hypothetical protein